MVYLKSFFRRLQFKSALYFSFPLALFVAILTQSPWTFFQVLCTGTFLLQLGHVLVNQHDRKSKSGVRCQLCSHPHSVLLYPQRKRQEQLRAKGDFACSSFDHAFYPDIYFCPLCKNAFLSSLCETLFEQTVREGHQLYAQVADQKYIENLPHRVATYHRVIANHRAVFEGKRVLEIGSYYGVFYEAGHKIMQSYVGVEPSTHACSYVRQKYPGIHIENTHIDAAIAELTRQQQKFDTIVMWDVIEHLPNPLQALRGLNSLLQEGGSLLFSTINIESSFSLALGPFWPWYMDMHYYYFSDRGLVDILHRSGHILTHHEHFRYTVSARYLMEKVLAILGRKTNTNLNQADSILNRLTIPIQLGDTVLIRALKERSCSRPVYDHLQDRKLA